jgi:hypothetical protein
MTKLLLASLAAAGLSGCMAYGGGVAYDGGYYSSGYPAYGYSTPYPAYPAYGYPGYEPGLMGGVIVERGGSRGWRDRDRDGVPNRYDRDRDGDGVPNRRDAAPDDPRRR